MIWHSKVITGQKNCHVEHRVCGTDRKCFAAWRQNVGVIVRTLALLATRVTAAYFYDLMHLQDFAPLKHLIC